METNILIAFKNLVKNPITSLVSHYQGSNRINSMGAALEFYIKDLLCNTFAEENLNRKYETYSRYLSYIGNQNNPPDIMIKNGDAIEVKKIESMQSSLALNSSYPKDKLYSESPMITVDCRNCEDWSIKDIIYIIGYAQKNILKALWFVYGDCYAADKAIYERIRNKISDGVNELQDVEFSKTKELGRVNRVDPLGITYLRIRGMWGIDNPIKVFNYTPIEQSNTFFANFIMMKEKYISFPMKDRESLEMLIGEKFSIKDIKIKSPNNPAKLLEAKLLCFRE